MPGPDDPRGAFLAHAERVQVELLSLKLSEADTRSYLIDPVLAILGYEGVTHLRREVPVPATKEFIDYELLVDGEPQALVEAKAVRHAITAQHAAQCVQYATVLGVRWCLITNGAAWAVYDAHAKGPLEEKRVAEVRLDGDAAATEQAWSVLSVFARDTFGASSPLSALLIERVVIDELSAPDSKAVAALRSAVQKRFGERVTGGAIVDVLDRLRRRGVPSASQPSPAPAPTPTPASPPDRPARPPGRPARKAQPKGQGTRVRVTLPDLVNANLLPADAVLEARVQGISHVARIRDGEIELDGTRYPTPSAASCALRRTKAWNGWVDWHYKGESLAEIRERFRASVQNRSPQAPV